MIKDILNKKLIVLLMGAGLTLTSCFDDDSKEGQPISDITIADFEESTYTKVSYIGETLEISPSIDTEYPESDLEYLWTIVPVQASNSSKYEQPTEISTEKNLKYEVNLSPKTYTIRLQVSSKSNGYAVNKTTKLVATTQFSHGFYLLKETTDGNSELDLLLQDGSFSENLLSKFREGGAIKGTPRNLTIGYSHYYIDDETNEIDHSNLIYVITNDRKISAFRADDLKEIYTQDKNMFYGTFGADEEPYAVQTGYFMTHYFSNKGVTSCYTNFASPYSSYSGKYGLPETETGGSVYMTRNSYNIDFWDADNHCLYACDYNGGISLITEQDGTELELSNYDCIAAGSNVNTEALFILQDKDTKERVVYEIHARGYFSKKYTIDASKHIATSDIVRVNARQGYYLYSVDDNKLYGYDWTSGNEIEMTLQGIGSGETINYISNQHIGPGYFGSMNDDFDYLAIGTQSGNTYHLYFYEMVGGQPAGEPVLKASGTGRINNVRFVTTSITSDDATYGHWVLTD